MGIRNTCFLGNMVERGGAEIQEDNDNRFGDWGISVDNDRLCPFSAESSFCQRTFVNVEISCLAIAEVRLLDMVQMDLFLLMGGLRKNILQMENIRRRRNW